MEIKLLLWRAHNQEILTTSARCPLSQDQRRQFFDKIFLKSEKKWSGYNLQNICWFEKSTFKMLRTFGVPLGRA